MSNEIKTPQKKKSLWTKEEDDKLCYLIRKTGNTNWAQISMEMKTRNSKQCRERWINVLSPNVNCEQWTPSEDSLILNFARVYGNQWANVSKLLNGRSPNAIKNRYRLLCRRKTPVNPQPPAVPIETAVVAAPAPCLLDASSHQLFYLVPVMTVV